MVKQWVKELTESVIGGPPFKIGDRVKRPSGRLVEIISGMYWGEHGLSNHWGWREILPDGTLAKQTEYGYGWEVPK